MFICCTFFGSVVGHEGQPLLALMLGMKASLCWLWCWALKLTYTGSDVGQDLFLTYASSDVVQEELHFAGPDVGQETKSLLNLTLGRKLYLFWLWCWAGRPTFAGPDVVQQTISLLALMFGRKAHLCWPWWWAGRLPLLTLILGRSPYLCLLGGWAGTPGKAW